MKPLLRNPIPLDQTFLRAQPADGLVHIDEITGHRLDVELKRPFVIHDASLTHVTNAAVCLRLKSGIVGWGEVPVLPTVTPETQGVVLDDIRRVAPLLAGEQRFSMFNWADKLKERIPDYPALRAGLEVAYYDALCQSFKLGMHYMLGGEQNALVKSDITIPICGLDEARELAGVYAAEGFETIKIKVGADVDDGINRMIMIRSGFPGARFIVDANQAFTAGAALAFLQEVKRAGLGDALALFEQPVHRDDPEGLSWVTREGGVKVAADESVRNIAEAKDIIDNQRAHVINIKLAKLGFVDAARIVEMAKQQGIGLMMGGMVETHLGMSVAAMFAAGLGGFEFFDVDTPRLLKHDPIVGGAKLVGATYDLSQVKAGHGMSLPE